MVSAVAGSSLGLAIICGYAARSAVAVTKHGGWNDARQFLGLSGKRKWYTTWTR
jgi:hypothetical protein